MANGTRRLVMSFRGSIPSSVSVAEFPVCVFYLGQPVTCSICCDSGHLPRACPFSGLHLRCKQPGHVARNCTQAWGPSSSSTFVSVPSTVPAPVPVPVSSSVPEAVHPPAPLPSSVPLSAPVSTLPSTSVLSALSVVSPVSSPTVSPDVPLEDGEIADPVSPPSSFT